MLSFAASLLLGVAVIGQAPAEASWLKSVPADVPVAVRARALEDARADLLTMLKAMSPAAAAAAADPTAQALQTLEPIVGKVSGKNPFFLLMRLPDLAQPGIPAWSVIIKADDYKATITQLAQGGGEIKSLDGHDSFTANVGQTWYATKGDGWVAFGQDETMIKAIHKPQATLAATLAPEVQAKFLAGDLGLYVNLSEVWRQYGPTIEQLAPALLAQLEQNPNAGGPQGIKNAKLMIDGLTQALKDGKDLALALDFEADGFSLTGLATVKDDIPAAKSLAGAKTSSAALLAKLPSNMTMYLSATDVSGFQKQALQMGAGTPGVPKSSPKVDEAVAARTRALGGRLVMGMTLSPMQVVTLAESNDPAAAVKATLDAAEARKELNKEQTTIDRNALSYGGFQLNRVKTKIDPKALEEAAKQTRPGLQNPAAISGKIMPGESVSTYTGTDGTLFVELMAQSDEQAKQRINAIKNGSDNLGSLPSWKTIRAKFPKETTVLFIVNAQELIRQIQGFRSAVEGVNAQQAELPKAPALVGFGLVVSPKGYDFQLVVPSEIGPVVEAAMGMGQGK